MYESWLPYGHKTTPFMADMDYKEEQTNELEALQSIFENDFAKKGDSAFEITLKPHANDKGDKNHVIALLKITFPANYPEVVPGIVVENVKGLNDAQVGELTQLAQSKVEQNLGQPMIYDLTEDLKQWLLTNNKKEVTSLHDKIREESERVKKEQEEREAKEAEARAASEKKDKEEAEEEEVHDNISTIVIPPNTLVSDQAFQWWNKQFLEEQARRKAEMLAASGVKDTDKSLPTGKEIFIKNLLQNLDDDIDEEPDTAPAASTTGTAGGRAGAGAGGAGAESKDAGAFCFDASLFDDDDGMEGAAAGAGGGDDEGKHGDEDGGLLGRGARINLDELEAEEQQHEQQQQQPSTTAAAAGSGSSSSSSSKAPALTKAQSSGGASAGSGSSSGSSSSSKAGSSSSSSGGGSSSSGGGSKDKKEKKEDKKDKKDKAEKTSKNK